MNQFKIRFKNIFRSINSNDYPIITEKPKSNKIKWIAGAVIVIGSLLYFLSNTSEDISSASIDKLIEKKQNNTITRFESDHMCKSLKNNNDWRYYKYCESKEAYFKVLFLRYYDPSNQYPLTEEEIIDLKNFREDWDKKLTWALGNEKSKKLTREERLHVFIKKEHNKQIEKNKKKKDQKFKDYLNDKSFYIKIFLNELNLSDMKITEDITISYEEHYHYIFNHFLREEETMGIKNYFKNKTYFEEFSSYQMYLTEIELVIHSFQSLGVLPIDSRPDDNQYVIYYNIKGLSKTLFIGKSIVTDSLTIKTLYLNNNLDVAYKPLSNYNIYRFNSNLKFYLNANQKQQLDSIR